MRSLLKGLRDTVRGVASLRHGPADRAQLLYLTREVHRLSAQKRRADWEARRRTGLETQTKASFNFQWHHLPTGAALPGDDSFMRQLEHELPSMVGVGREWFAGRRVVDVGCGIGRYTFGLLRLGASVTACDQSEAALRRTADLCHADADRLTLQRIDLLEWSERAAFDLAFSYGVVHHTGNTYLAIENVCRKVAAGGRVFFMIYAVPATLPAFEEVNLYEALAAATRDLSFEARREYIERRFGPEKAHGWFDAVSPRINDRLTFEEIHDVLTELGFGGITGRTVARNHYVTAERARDV